MATNSAPRNYSESGLARQLTSLPGGYYRRREIADALGVTPRAILMAGKTHPELRPTGSTFRGRKEIHLFTEDQVEALRKHFHKRGPRRGKPRIWTLEESSRRQREYDLARYYSRRAKELSDQGKSDEAVQARQRAMEIQSRLDQERDKRVGPKESRRNGSMPDLRDEYHLTLRVLAVVTERLLAATKGQLVEIGEGALRDSPDLIAARDDKQGRIVLTTER